MILIMMIIMIMMIMQPLGNIIKPNILWMCIIIIILLQDEPPDDIHCFDVSEDHSAL